MSKSPGLYAGPVEIRITYDELTNKAGCTIYRAGKVYDDFPVLVFCMILNQIQNGYIQAGLNNLVGGGAPGAFPGALPGAAPAGGGN